MIEGEFTSRIRIWVFTVLTGGSRHELYCVWILQSTSSSRHGDEVSPRLKFALDVVNGMSRVPQRQSLHLSHTLVSTYNVDFTTAGRGCVRNTEWPTFRRTTFEDSNVTRSACSTPLFEPKRCGLLKSKGISLLKITTDIHTDVEAQNLILDETVWMMICLEGEFSKVADIMYHLGRSFLVVW